MKIQKCSDFITEKIKYKDLRWLINGHGIAKNTHGTIEDGEIIGDDGETYIGGFNLVYELVPGKDHVTDDGFLTTANVIFNGKGGIPKWNIYSDIKTKKVRAWTLEEIRQANIKYAEPHQITEDLTIYNQSWVNVKIDMTISDKVSRHMKIFDQDGTPEGTIKTLRDRIKILSNPNILPEGDDWTLGLQKKISAILCLRYLAEIKINFDPSSAGFIFESFLAGIVGGRAINDDSEKDIIAGNTSFQLKFYGIGSSSIPIFKETTLTRLDIVRNAKVESKTAFVKRLVAKKKQVIDAGEILFNYALIAVKERNKIHMCLISKKELHQELNDMLAFRNQKLKGGSDFSYIKTPGLFGVSGTLKTSEVLNYKIATLDLSFVSGSNLQAILHDLDVNITAVWKNVGELQENIESITTGITKEGKRVEIEVAETKAMENLDEIKVIIEEGILGQEAK
jgi:hypothetical protein